MQDAYLRTLARRTNEYDECAHLRVPVISSPITTREVVLRGRVAGATEVAEAEDGA